MTIDVHDRARRLLAAADSETLPSHEQAWLRAHLDACPACREFSDTISSAVQALRAIPFAADRNLVAVTQSRVRRRAVELRRQRERMWIVFVSCTVVTFFAALSTLALWRGFAWIGSEISVAPIVWQMGFLVFCGTPALVAGILLMIRDTHLANHAGSYHGG